MDMWFSFVDNANTYPQSIHNHVLAAWTHGDLPTRMGAKQLEPLYSFDVVEHANGDGMLMIRLPDHMRVVETFLLCEMDGQNESSLWILEGLEKVLGGECTMRTVLGRQCTLEIDPQTTVILNHLADRGDNQVCTVPTGQLRKLIHAWLDERRSFYGRRS